MMKDAVKRVIEERLAQSLRMFSSLCMKCGLCEKACPISGIAGQGDSTPLKRIDAARRVLENDDVTDEDVRVLFSCLLCGACSIACPFGIDVYRIIFLARSLSAIKGCSPKDLSRIAEGASQSLHSFGSSIIEANKWTEYIGSVAPVDKKGAEVLYIPSPVETAFLPQHAAETAMILNKLGVDWTISSRIADGGGNVAIDCSRPDIGLVILNKLLEEAERLGVRKIALGACGSDYKWIMMAKELFPTLIRKHHRVVFTSVYTVISEKYRPAGKNGDVMLHDPCSMTRYIRVEDKYLALLKNASRPSKKGVYTLCCGGSGGLSLRKDKIARDLLLKIASVRLKELAGSSNRTIVTPCIKCYITFKMAALRKGLNINVCGLSSYINSKEVEKYGG